jgi:hypothetical protein
MIAANILGVNHFRQRYFRHRFGCGADAILCAVIDHAADLWATLLDIAAC